MNNINKLFKSIFQGKKENTDRIFNQIMAEKLTQAKEIRKVGLTAEIFNNNKEAVMEATSADLKKVLDAAKKAGADVSGNTIDFGEGSVIKVSIEKGKIKFDGGKSSDTEYFDSVKDAMMAFESVDLDEESLNEAVSANKFVKGGNDKISQSEVDDLLGDIYDSSSLTKSLVRNKAYQAGEDNPKGTNPYKKDTVDYHLFLLGQQMEKSRS